MRADGGPAEAISRELAEDESLGAFAITSDDTVVYAVLAALFHHLPPNRDNPRIYAD